MYYRIYPQDEIENATEGKLFIEQTSAPVLVSPAQDSVFELENYDEKITFSWKTDRNTDFCRIEIYDGNDSGTPVFSGDVTGTSFSYSQFYEGTFLWCIVPHYAANKNDFGAPSALHKFSVAKKQMQDSPVLLFPADSSTVTLGEKESAVMFGWKSDVKDSEYRFEISKDEDFRTVLYDSSETDTRKQLDCSIGTLPEGTYFWRVSRSGGETDFYSDIRRFQVSQYVPQTTELVYPPDNFTVEGEKLRNTQFSWKLADGLRTENVSCVIRFSQDEGGAEHSAEYKASSAQEYRGVQLGEGTYFWQVAAVDRTTGAEIARTAARKISVVNPLESPAVVFPKDDFEYVITPDAVLKCEWEAVPGADFYSVKVYDGRTNEIVAKADSADGNGVQMRIPQYDELKSLGELALKCSVTAFAGEKENSPMRASRSANVNFTLKFAERVALNSPENGAQIAGLTAVRTPTKFTWTEDKTVRKRTFVLSKKAANGTMRVVNETQNPKNVALSRLSPGDYSWTVRAETKDGVPLSAAEPFAFTILPVPLRDAVRLSSPADNFVIGPKYLKNNRRIEFEWKKDDAATDYVFTLYQKNKNGTLRRIVSEKTRGTRFVFSDLAKLDVGQFEWHVVSYTHARDGFEEQKSRTAKANFSISFDLPGAVQTIEPGEMYGN